MPTTSSIEDELYTWLDEMRPTLVPGTLLAKAITHAKNMSSAGDVLGINSQEYLQDIVEKLADGWPMARIAELTAAGRKRARDQTNGSASDVTATEGDAPDSPAPR